MDIVFLVFSELGGRLCQLGVTIKERAERLHALPAGDEVPRFSRRDGFPWGREFVGSSLTNRI
jgi:hypothetical protein